MIYRYSSQVKDDFIADILRIDESVYDSSVLGSDESLRSRFNTNRESFILAYDEAEIVGYIAFFPITSDLSEKMKTEDKLFDNDIKREDILPTYSKEEGEDFDIFLMSVAVLPAYQGMGIGAELAKKCISFIKTKKDDGCKIRNLYSYAVTDGGSCLLNKNNFIVNKRVSNSVYSDIKFMQYSFDDTDSGLLYKDLSVIFFQLFTLPDSCERIIESEEYVKGKKDRQIIDNQIFVYNDEKNTPKKYELKAFAFDLSLKKPFFVRIAGKVHVEMSLYHKKTVSITYRMVINEEVNAMDFLKRDWKSFENLDDIGFVSDRIQYVKSSDLLTTDHLISLLSLFMDAECWDTKDDRESRQEALIKVFSETECLKPLIEAVREIDSKVTPETLEKLKSDFRATDELINRLEKALESQDLKNTAIQRLIDIATSYLEDNATINKQEKGQLIEKLDEIYNQKSFDEFSYGNITLEIDGLSIKELFLDNNGEWKKDVSENLKSLDLKEEHTLFKQVFERYKKCALKMCKDEEKRSILSKAFSKKAEIPETFISDSKYVYVDICESLQHQGCNSFDELDEEAIISHIAEHHKEELIGLMSLYPEEWPFRDHESYDDVCGRSIAIDTDDLVIVNQKMCVAFGTYGKRGDEQDAINWRNHLKVRAALHVSWPEYLLILEMLLVKKHTIKYAYERLLESACSEKAIRNPASTIEANAVLHLEIIQMIANLDAVKYLKFESHKIMYDRTIKRLGVEEDRAGLDGMMDRIGNSLSIKRDTQSIKQGNKMNAILFIISIVSLFQIILSENKFPWLENLVGEKKAEFIANSVIVLAIITFFICVGFVIFSIHRFIKKMIK